MASFLLPAIYLTFVSLMAPRRAVAASAFPAERAAKG